MSIAAIKQELAGLMLISRQLHCLCSNFIGKRNRLLMRMQQTLTKPSFGDKCVPK